MDPTQIHPLVLFLAALLVVVVLDELFSLVAYLTSAPARDDG